jgi:FtsP/CotA-like multicopper oxidase with cupredoxin domain
VFAEREGERARTGFVLATKAARVHRLAAAADAPAGAVGLDLERRLRAAAPLPARAADRLHRVELGGGGADYAWFIDGRTFEDHAPLPVRKGERVEIAMRNATEMAHPMHLHGHPFQVVEIDGTGLAGAVRDSVMVPPAGSVRIAFDADNPGHWAFHCHHLYHMVAGMMASVKYEDA